MGIFEAPPTYDDALKHPAMPPGATGAILSPQTLMPPPAPLQDDTTVVDSGGALNEAFVEDATVTTYFILITSQIVYGLAHL